MKQDQAITLSRFELYAQADEAGGDGISRGSV